MEISKHNVCQVIEDYLKSNHIRYTISGQDSKGLLYALHVGYLECYLQVEYNLEDDDDDFIVVQLFTEVDDYDKSLYDSEWDNKKDGLEEEIETLIEETKKINSAIGKIEKHIEKIKEICEEYELDMDKFIYLKYKF